METVVLEDQNPVAGFDDPIKLEITKRRKRAVILHPILGGNNKIVAVFAKFFGWFGWTTIIQYRARRPHEYDTLEQVELGVQNMMHNNQQAWDYLVSEGIIEPNKTLVLGASYGGINTALASTQLPAAGFMSVVGGADIPDIFDSSEEPAIKEWKHSNDPQEWQAFLPSVTTDPQHLCAQRSGEGVLLCNALFDKTVPTENQAKLRDAYGSKPTTLWWLAGHYTIILWLPIICPIAVLFGYWRTR